MKKSRLKTISVICVILPVSIITWYWLSFPTLEEEKFRSIYVNPSDKLESPIKVFHLGHSLVGRDMPSMLQQLAVSGHTYESQLGWGTRLNAHWDDEVPIKGFDIENNHERFRPAHDAIKSGDYDALILTEGIGLRASIKYYQSYYYLHKWAHTARLSNPEIKVYLYETWHSLDGADNWLTRIDEDLPHLWENEIIKKALALDPELTPIYVIPAGQVIAHFVRYIEKHGGIGNIKSRHDLFVDDIHFNDLGAYLIALTHYAVLYHKSPVGLPHKLLKADGAPAMDPGPILANVMQEIVWQVVTSYPKTGVEQSTSNK